MSTAFAAWLHLDLGYGTVAVSSGAIPFLCLQAHPKFESVAGCVPLLYSRELQMGADKVALPMSLGEAVSRGIIANETLGYFIGRTHLFLVSPDRCSAHTGQETQNARNAPRRMHHVTTFDTTRIIVLCKMGLKVAIKHKALTQIMIFREP